MGLFSKRRIRKSSPSPRSAGGGSPSCRDDDGCVASPAVRSRINNTNNTNNHRYSQSASSSSNGALPLVSPSPRGPRVKNAGGSNLLLFGGQYYPGKDKQRRTHFGVGGRQRRQRRSFLTGGRQRYNSNCSSSLHRRLRKLGMVRASASAVCLFVFVMLLIPRGINFFVDIKVNRRVDHDWTWTRMSSDFQDHNSKISLKKERERVAKLQIEMEALDAEGGSQERLNLLKRLVPQFVNRNKKPTTTTTTSTTTTASVATLEKEPSRKSPPSIPNALTSDTNIRKRSARTAHYTKHKKSVKDSSKKSRLVENRRRQQKQQRNATEEENKMQSAKNRFSAPKRTNQSTIKHSIGGDDQDKNDKSVSRKSMAIKEGVSNRDSRHQQPQGQVPSKKKEKVPMRSGFMSAVESSSKMAANIASPVDPRSKLNKRIDETQSRRMKRVQSTHSKRQSPKEIPGDVDAADTTEAAAGTINLQDVQVIKPKLRTLSTMADFVNETSCPAAGLEAMEITLVTQTTLDRLWILEETCLRWHMPIVAVVPLTPEQRRDEAAVAILGSRSWHDDCPQLQLIQYALTDSSTEPRDYPVNLLRNLGLNAVETSHVLLADIDFVPSQDLDKTIHNTLQLKQQLRPLLRKGDNAMPSAARDAMVVPAFERIPPEPCITSEECKHHLQGDHNFIPHSFEDIRKCVSNKDCIVFQSKDNWEGHFTTDSEAWLAKQWFEGPAVQIGDSRFRDVRRIPCFDTLRYEPYLVLEWCPTSGQERPLEAVAPYYDERFHGYGKNKISYIQHLRLSGYQFSVLPNGFLVHNPHVESRAKEVWSKQGSKLHHDMDRLYPKFLQELVDKYQPRKGHVVEMCSRNE